MHKSLTFFLSLFLASLTFVIAEDLISYCFTGDDGIVIVLSEEEQNEKTFEKGIKLFTTSNKQQATSNASVRMKHNFAGLQFFYPTPTIREEIKPPHFL